MNGKSNRNEGISIIADFRDRAVSVPSTPGAANLKASCSRNAGIQSLAEFRDKAELVKGGGADSPDDAEAARRVSNSMAQLSPMERHVALSFFFDQRDQHDIAAELGISDSAAQKILARILANIRTSLARG